MKKMATWLVVRGSLQPAVANVDQGLGLGINLNPKPLSALPHIPHPW
jgi:hypothetical protein